MKRSGYLTVAAACILVLAASVLIGCSGVVSSGGTGTGSSTAASGGLKANGEARAHLDASIGALRGSVGKLKALEIVMEEFAADAPSLKWGDKFAARWAAVAAAIDDAGATVAKARTEVRAAEAVPGVSDAVVLQAADLLVDEADSTDKVLLDSVTILHMTMGSPAQFRSMSASSTRARVLFLDGADRQAG